MTQWPSYPMTETVTVIHLSVSTWQWHRQRSPTRRRRRSPSAEPEWLASTWCCCRTPTHGHKQLKLQRIQSINQSIIINFFRWPYIMEKWIGGADGWQSVAWRVSGVEVMCFKRSFEGNQGGRITDESRYIVPGSRCWDCKWVFVEVRGGVRPVQSGSSARPQCSQWLMPMQLTRKVSRCASMDGTECNGPELEADTLADRQPV